MTQKSSFSLSSSSELSLSAHRYRIFLLWGILALTCLLIFVGALVTSNDAGLSVPDWPSSYGYNMFLFPPSLWIGGIVFEHVHRLIASTLGGLTLLFCIWTLWKEPRRNIKVLSVLMLLAVTVQGIFGGLTVWYLLPDWISTTHAVLGQTFFMLVIAMTYFHSAEFISVGEIITDNKERKFAAVLLAIVYLQLIVAAYMRHSGAGLAVPDFPTVGGEWLPAFNETLLTKLTAMRHSFAPQLAPVTMLQVVVHLLHRALAVLILGVVLLLWRSRGTKRALTTVIAALVFVQFSLGIIALLSERHPILTSLHVITGALLLGSITYLNLKLFTKGSNAF